MNFPQIGNTKLILTVFILLFFSCPVIADCIIFLEEDYGVTGDGSDEGYEISSTKGNFDATGAWRVQPRIIFGSASSATIHDSIRSVTVEDIL